MSRVVDTWHRQCVAAQAKVEGGNITRRALFWAAHIPMFLLETLPAFAFVLSQVTRQYGEPGLFLIVGLAECSREQCIGFTWEPTGYCPFEYGV